MRSCEDCTNRECETTGKPCKAIESYLNSKQSDEELLGIERLYTDRHIRRVEIPYDPRLFEQFLPWELVKRLRGGEARTNHQEE
jgi:hypothetical protein